MISNCFNNFKLNVLASWERWSRWGTCNGYCGTRGTQSRTRQCFNGNVAGIGCQGIPSDDQYCDVPLCVPTTTTTTTTTTTRTTNPPQPQVERYAEFITVSNTEKSHHNNGTYYNGVYHRKPKLSRGKPAWTLTVNGRLKSIILYKHKTFRKGRPAKRNAWVIMAPDRTTSGKRFFCVRFFSFDKKQTPENLKWYYLKTSCNFRQNRNSFSRRDGKSIELNAGNSPTIKFSAPPIIERCPTEVKVVGSNEYYILGFTYDMGTAVPFSILGQSLWLNIFLNNIKP